MVFFGTVQSYGRGVTSDKFPQINVRFCTYICKFAQTKQLIDMAGNRKIYINRNNSDLWKEDTCRSVEMYNEWFLGFAPSTYISEREKSKR